MGHALSVAFAEDKGKARRSIRELVGAAMPDEAWEVEGTVEQAKRKEAVVRRRRMAAELKDGKGAS